MAKQILGIFAKQPIAGQVKTRLCPPLSPQQAAELYRSCLQETIAAMAAAPAERVLFFAGDRSYFAETFPGLRLIPQSDGDLGRRLDQAFAQLFAEGCSAAALIGSDSPDLPLPLVADAFAALNHHDLAIAPARDGGYVLIGQSVHNPGLFRDMPWSSFELWPTTRQRAEQLGLSFRELDTWEDLDDLACLQRFCQRSPDSSTAYLARLMLSTFPVLSN
jgi:hypothetical protein